MAVIPESPVEQWGIGTVKRRFINEYEAYHAGRTDGVLHITLLHQLYKRLQNENVDIDSLIEDQLPPSRRA